LASLRGRNGIIGEDLHIGASDSSFSMLRRFWEESRDRALAEKKGNIESE